MSDPVPTPQATYPAPNGVSWRVYSSWRGPATIRSTVVAELVDARSIQVHFDLRGPATASFTLDGRSSGAAALQELSQDAVLYRWHPGGAYQVMFRGPIGHTQDQVTETTHSLNVTAADYRAMLTRRPVGGPLSFTQVDQFEIAKQLIMGTLGWGGTPYDMNMNIPGLSDPGSTTNPPSTGVLRDRVYVGSEKTADMVNNLSAVANGFDWGVDPIDPVFTPLGSSGQPWIWYPQRGTTKTFIADYGTTVSSVSRTVDSTSFANWVRNDGQNDEAGNPVFAVAEGDAITNPQLHAEGFWPEGISNPSTTDLTTLQEQANGELGLASILVPSYSLNLVVGAWTGKADCWLGDTIGVRVRSGRLNVNTTARIIQIDFKVDDNGVERITLTVARVVPTLADLLTDQRSELDALARR